LVKLCPNWPDVLFRYVTSAGGYPYVINIKTPIGLLSLQLHDAHDLRTVNEIFFRNDYPAPCNIGVVIDIGSNIGISGAYFMTRNKDCKCYLYEPLPSNIAKLKKNLEAFEGRFVLNECAVSTVSGMRPFYTEPTGRYGTLVKPLNGCIRVMVRNINGILAEVLSENPLIDLIKIDIEGLEEEVVNAIDKGFLYRIRLIVCEIADQVRVFEPAQSQQ
jgi:FkbM family methyltransferase